MVTRKQLTLSHYTAIPWSVISLLSTGSVEWSLLNVGLDSALVTVQDELSNLISRDQGVARPAKVNREDLSPRSKSDRLRGCLSNICI